MGGNKFSPKDQKVGENNRQLCFACYLFGVVGLLPHVSWVGCSTGFDYNNNDTTSLAISWQYGCTIILIIIYPHLESVKHDQKNKQSVPHPHLDGFWMDQNR